MLNKSKKLKILRVRWDNQPILARAAWKIMMKNLKLRKVRNLNLSMRKSKIGLNGQWNKKKKNNKKLYKKLRKSLNQKWRLSAPGFIEG